MHVTIVGRFFSGEKVRYPGGESWSGYGHMGCCTLLMIQQVLSVDPHNRNDLDYGAAADQPNINKAGCGYSFLGKDTRFNDVIELQRKAESGDRAWAFDDPRRVAVEKLARETKTEASLFKNLTLTRQTQGRVVYKWKPKRARVSYIVVVSRPYVLSFYARDPGKVVWVVSAAYRIGCGDDLSSES